MTIGERIKYLRENVRMSQEQLGRMCGTTKQTIYKYESGVVTNIPSDKIELIAHIFETTPAFLMGWEERQQPVGQLTDGLDDELVRRLLLLTPEELAVVDAFVQGILATH